MSSILETKRLTLRQFEVEDAAFIFELVNTPDWLTYIGDKHIRSVDDAKTYLLNGPLKSYQENGWGLWMIELKESQTSIGMCGLLKRNTLDDIDIGFAILPKYFRMGYGFEIASATLNYATQKLKIQRIVAIVSPGNVPSTKLLNKLGLQHEKTLNLPGDNQVLLFS